MKLSHQKIAVTVNTFSKNDTLVNELRKDFPDFSITSKRYTEDELIDALKYSDGAIVGMDNINKDVLKNCKNLKVISKYGVGLDNINLRDCQKYGIAVKYSPGINKRAVAELTLGFMLNLSRNIYKTSEKLKQGIWDKNGGFSLTDKKIGIIGVGNVGKDLIELLKPFNCEISVNDILDQKEYYIKKNLIESTKEEIYKNSDIITIHTPLTNETQNMVNKEAFSLMKPTAFLINTARGKIVNEEDLYNALSNNKISGAALDVYYEEPPKNKELFSLENLICTPHIGGNSKEAVLAMGYAAIKNLKDFFENE